MANIEEVPGVFGGVKTEEEFNKTFEFLKEIKFYKMHVFPYSKRKGTRAAEMENQVDGNIKEQRSKILIDLSNKNQKEYNASLMGKKVEVLFEDRDEEYYKGHTQNYILVKYKTNENLDNILREVEVINADIDFVLA